MAELRPESLERITTKEAALAFIDQQTEEIRAQVGDGKVCLLFPAVLIHQSLQHF